MLSLDFLEGLEWWLMMSHLDEVIQVATSSSAVGNLVIFFLDRWEMFVLHPSTKILDSCQALLNFIDWWLVMFCLDELFQVTTRSSAVSNSVTFSLTEERCSFFIPPQNFPTAVKHFSIYWVMTDDVSFEWGHTSCNQFPNSCQALLHLLSDDWWCLIWMRLYKLQPGL